MESQDPGPPQPERTPEAELAQEPAQNDVEHESGNTVGDGAADATADPPTAVAKPDEEGAVAGKPVEPETSTAVNTNADSSSADVPRVPALEYDVAKMSISIASRGVGARHPKRVVKASPEQNGTEAIPLGDIPRASAVEHIPHAVNGSAALGKMDVIQPSSTTRVTFAGSADMGSSEKVAEPVKINAPLYPAFEFFKTEVQGGKEGAMEALMHVDIVTQQLGPELCGTLLVPFLAEAQHGMPIQLMKMAMDVWCTLSKISFAEAYVDAIVQGVSSLISQEDPDIRNRAVELIVNIVNDVRSSDAGYDVMASSVMPLLKRLSESEWFADAVSACKLIPLLYLDASEQHQEVLRQCYKQLWENSMLIVKLEVARNLETMLAIMHMDHAVSMFWLVLKNMSIDHQDEVRAHCVGACLAFAKRCTPEQNASLSYPVVQAAASDSSWRVRKALAVRFDKIHEVFGEAEMAAHFMSTHVALLTDDYDIVKEAAVESFLRWCRRLSPPMAQQYIAFFESHLGDYDSKNRQLICRIFAIFAAQMTRGNVHERLSPVLRRLLRDDCMDVRLSAIEHIEALCNGREFESGIGASITETVEQVLQSTRWRHRAILAEMINSFYHHFGRTVFERYFLRMLFQLLMDPVWKVRVTVVESIEALCADCKVPWVADTILTEIIKMYVEPRSSCYVKPEDVPLSYALKIVIIQALVAVTKSLDLQTTLARVLPIIFNATKDPTANVRFVAVKGLRSLFIIYQGKTVEAFVRARALLCKLLQDPDIDVKYYAHMAINTYDACFPSLLQRDSF
ncbi:HEAT repeat containing protein, putative [Babesia bigemina]|uniref:HEAT repeat containing protein, putative n=1 Tax=Babesia bigemina TaxID=5866 RepID=A0A061D2V2_BABBI|nr:HEAT repeat containing protein, putative [Babesia bigemina]CDR94938.1 HEAT repeat containing protein, putative [Babesia bigemina]|eukprot:XP_012767124.1 HEAT repeat containing protein, putative [Babesia bigemina]